MDEYFPESKSSMNDCLNGMDDEVSAIIMAYYIYDYS